MNEGCTGSLCGEEEKWQAAQDNKSVDNLSSTEKKDWGTHWKTHHPQKRITAWLEHENKKKNRVWSRGGGKKKTNTVRII